MLQINPGLILWTIITFVLLLIVLSKIAWKPLLTALQSREKSLSDALQQAEQAKKDSERMLEENKRALAQANAETARIIREGKELAEHMKGEIVAKANESAKQMMAKAKEDIEREKESALLQLRGEVADLAVNVAEKIIGESLDTAKQKKMVDTVIKQLTKN